MKNMIAQIVCMGVVMVTLANFVAKTACGQRPTAESLLPIDTLAYVSIRDVREFASSLDETSLGRMAKQQQMQSLTEQLFEEAESAFAPLSEQVGLTIRQLLGIPRGELTMAIVTPDRGLPAAVLFADVKGQEEKVDRLWQVADAELGSRWTPSTQNIGGTTLTIFTQQDERWTGLVRFRREGIQVVCTNLEVAEALLARWDGNSDAAGVDENAAFRNVMRMSRGPQGADPHVRWFLDPIRLARISMRGNFSAQTALAILPVIGADGLRCLGGSVTVATDQYDGFVQMHAICDQPRTGVLGMLAMQNGDPEPEAWVPENVARYQTTYWDLVKTKEEFKTLFNSFRGDEAFENEISARARERMGTDIVADISAAWGGRASIAMWYEPGTVLGQESYLVGMRLLEEHEFEQVIAQTVERFEEELTENLYDGVTYYASRVLRETSEDDGDPKDAARVCFGIVDDYFLAANSSGAFERAVMTRRSGIASLSDALEFKLMRSKLSRYPQGRSPGYFAFDRPEKAMEVLHRMATAESTTELLSNQQDNPLLGSLYRSLEANPLPPFSVLRKYFSPTVSMINGDESGFHFTSFGLRRK